MTPSKIKSTDEAETSEGAKAPKTARKATEPVKRRVASVRAKKVEEVKEPAVAKSEPVAAEPVVAEVESVVIDESGFPKAGAHTYMESVGRRKRAIARVRLWKGGKFSIVVNKKPWTEYFPTELLQLTVSSPFKAVGQWERHEITCVVKGGGPNGQAEAVRHGVAQVLLQLNPVFRKALKKAGFLKRDPREKERKKYGLRGARRAPQWQKR